MAVFDGMLTEYVPVPLNTPPTLVGSAPPVHVYGPTGLTGLGTKTKLKVPLFHDCAPASVIVPLTVVDCEKAWAEDKRRSPSVRRTLRNIESSLWRIVVPLRLGLNHLLRPSRECRRPRLCRLLGGCLRSRLWRRASSCSVVQSLYVKRGFLAFVYSELDSNV